MKNIFCIILVFFGTAVFAAAAGIAEEAERGNARADTSYAFGMAIADDLVNSGLEFNYDALIRGLRDVIENRNTLFSMEEAFDKIDDAFAAADAKITERAIGEAEAFLAANGARPGVIVTPSGLQFELISEGSGEMPNIADTVLVHYQGADIYGNIFDSTYEYGEPIEIPLDRVIPGWSEGLRMMREGSRARLFIPSDLAYGERGAGGIIAPYAVLVFEVELLEILPSDDMYFYWGD
ncbi:MAG: FKBP-type peptidyl-prolyl cis-trans isomerase [Treponema sp.]|jgi:FKBP-type peptidyl-prolyl cis-trans isomerase FklB|nr:FKBP-type peptidyl-prolyl cis-trans isomerase [Treponema sp.]